MCSKKCLSKREAESALNRNAKHPKKWRREIRYYYCKECNAWHLTSHEYEDSQVVETIKLIFKNKWKKLLKKK